MNNHFDIPDEILHARLTSFMDTLVLPEIRRISNWDFGDQDEYVIGLISNNGPEDLNWSPYSIEQSEAMTSTLLLFEKLDLLRRGQIEGYFVDNWQDAIDLVQRITPDRKERFTNVFDAWIREPIADHQRLLEILRTQERDDFSWLGFNTRYATILDIDTPEFREFVRLTLFAPAREWNFRIEQVELLIDEILRNPAVLLTAAELDELAWALSGADDMPTPGRLYFPQYDAPITRAFAHVENSARLAALRSARARLADIAPIITADENTAALRALDRERYMSRVDRERPRKISREYTTLRSTFENPPDFL
ncbi:hypothetical protein [Rhodococcus sp. NPDC060176]|uniref:hypothetical protein n=1 Tax=Rhodococcus sp. NPDC060176 TaxID=3347062 RepID=UPI0036586149